MYLEFPSLFVVWVFFSYVPIMFLEKKFRFIIRPAVCLETWIFGILIGWHFFFTEFFESPKFMAKNMQNRFNSHQYFR